jgi:hypothetical protein
MVEVHAKSAPETSLTFKGGLARALLWPGRGPRSVVTVIAFLSLLAVQAWDRDLGLWFWILGLVSGLLLYWDALRMYPALLDMTGEPTEAVRRTLSQMGYTPVAALEPESWRVPTLPWVTPSNPRFDVTLDPESGAVEGPWFVLRRISRRLRAAGVG